MIDHFYRCSDVPMMFLVCLDQPNALKLTEHNYSKHPNKRFGCFVRVSNFGCSRTPNLKLAENTKIGFDIYKIIVFLPKFGRFSISALSFHAFFALFAVTSGWSAPRCPSPAPCSANNRDVVGSIPTHIIYLFFKIKTSSSSTIITAGSPPNSCDTTSRLTTTMRTTR